MLQSVGIYEIDLIYFQLIARSPPKTGSSETSSVASMNLMDSNAHRSGSAGHAEHREVPDHAPHPLTYHSQHAHNDQQQQIDHQGANHSHHHHHAHQHPGELHSPSIHHHSYGHHHNNPSHPNLPPLTPTQDPFPIRDDINIHMGEQTVVPRY